VGFYPSGAQPWVHIDSGSVRYWPRMSRDALTRLFPDGKTVFIPADGQPLAGYEQARAEIEARGSRGGVAEPQVQVADAGPEAVAKAKRNLPTGPAYADSAKPAPAAKSEGL